MSIHILAYLLLTYFPASIHLSVAGKSAEIFMSALQINNGDRGAQTQLFPEKVTAKKAQNGGAIQTLHLGYCPHSVTDEYYS